MVCANLSQGRSVTPEVRVHSNILTLVFAASMLASCQVQPESGPRDAEEVDVYGAVVDAVRDELALQGQLTIHPYLSASVDSTGRPTLDIDHFDYVPSEALRLAQLRDSTLALCQPTEHGVCPASRYLILSRPVQTSERDATIVGILIDESGSAKTRYVSVRLRYRHEEWEVVGISQVV